MFLAINLIFVMFFSAALFAAICNRLSAMSTQIISLKIIASSANSISRLQIPDPNERSLNSVLSFRKL